MGNVKSNISKTTFDRQKILSYFNPGDENKCVYQLSERSEYLV
jgi:hypothetical protein